MCKKTIVEIHKDKWRGNSYLPNYLDDKTDLWSI